MYLPYPPFQISITCGNNVAFVLSYKIYGLEQMDQMLKMQGNIKKTIMGAVVRINHETTRFQHVN